MQLFLYLGLNTKFMLKGKMLCKGFEDKCLISEVFDIMQDYKKIINFNSRNKMKRILITGANKGIGLATVRRLLDSYDETFLLLGSRDLKKGQEALNSLVAKSTWMERSA